MRRATMPLVTWRCGLRLSRKYWRNFQIFHPPIKQPCAVMLMDKFTQWADEPTKISQQRCKRWHGFSGRRTDACALRKYEIHSQPTLGSVRSHASLSQQKTPCRPARLTSLSSTLTGSATPSLTSSVKERIQWRLSTRPMSMIAGYCGVRSPNIASRGYRHT